MTATQIHPDFMPILVGATQASPNKPTSQEVVLALLQAEKASKQQQHRYPLANLLGHWQLWFTTNGKVTLKQGQVVGKGGFYLPRLVTAQISFTTPAGSSIDPNQFQMGNQIQLGSLMFRVMGQARYLEQRNLLAFDVDTMQFSLFGKVLFQKAFPQKDPNQSFEQKPIAKLPFFSFFVVTENFIAARGRGGGLAIWRNANSHDNP